MMYMLVYWLIFQARSTFIFFCHPLTFHFIFFLLCHFIHFFLVSFYVLYFIFSLLSCAYFSNFPILSVSLISAHSFSSYFHFPSLVIQPLSFLFSSLYSLGLHITHNIFRYTRTMLTYTTVSPYLILCVK